MSFVPQCMINVLVGSLNSCRLRIYIAFSIVAHFRYLVVEFRLLPLESQRIIASAVIFFKGFCVFLTRLLVVSGLSSRVENLFWVGMVDVKGVSRAGFAWAVFGLNVGSVVVLSAGTNW